MIDQPKALRGFLLASSLAMLLVGLSGRSSSAQAPEWRVWGDPVITVNVTNGNGTAVNNAQVRVFEPQYEKFQSNRFVASALTNS